MIRSVLIAGMNNDDNQYTRYCDDLWLKWEHLPEIRNRHIPVKHDAVIVATAMASHELYYNVRDAYKAEEKPVFLSKVGISEIREDFERSVFGGEETLKKLRSPAIGTGKKDLSITARFWWVISTFKNPGDKLAIQDIQKFFDKFLIKDHKSGLDQAWHRGKVDDYLEVHSTGNAIFRSVPPAAIEAFKLHEIPYDTAKSNIPKIVVRKPGPVLQPVLEDKPKIIETSIPEPEPMKVEHQPQAETNASLELLLESMDSQQDAITALQAMVEKRIPEIIQHEIRGITTLLGSLVPKLQGLAPDQIAKVDQLLDLFLSR